MTYNPKPQELLQQQQDRIQQLSQGNIYANENIQQLSTTLTQHEERLLNQAKLMQLLQKVIEQNTQKFHTSLDELRTSQAQQISEQKQDLFSQLKQLIEKETSDQKDLIETLTKRSQNLTILSEFGQLQSNFEKLHSKLEQQVQPAVAALAEQSARAENRAVGLAAQTAQGLQTLQQKLTFKDDEQKEKLLFVSRQIADLQQQLKDRDLSSTQVQSAFLAQLRDSFRMEMLQGLDEAVMQQVRTAVAPAFETTLQRLVEQRISPDNLMAKLESRLEVATERLQSGQSLFQQRMGMQIEQMEKDFRVERDADKKEIQLLKDQFKQTDAEHKRRINEQQLIISELNDNYSSVQKKLQQLMQENNNIKQDTANVHEENLQLRAQVEELRLMLQSRQENSSNVNQIISNNSSLREEIQFTIKNVEQSVDQIKMELDHKINTCKVDCQNLITQYKEQLIPNVQQQSTNVQTEPLSSIYTEEYIKNKLREKLEPKQVQATTSSSIGSTVVELATKFDQQRNNIYQQNELPYEVIQRASSSPAPQYDLLKPPNHILPTFQQSVKNEYLEQLESKILALKRREQLDQRPSVQIDDLATDSAVLRNNTNMVLDQIDQRIGGQVKQKKRSITAKRLKKNN